MFGIGVVMTSVFTLLTPLAANHSVWLLVAVRVLEGFFEVSIDVVLRRPPMGVTVLLSHCCTLLDSHRFMLKTSLSLFVLRKGGKEKERMDCNLNQP